jgi:hypothetical protein
MPVALFSDRLKAEPVRRRLAQAGFTATFNDGPRLAKLWFVSDKSAETRVEVPAAEFNRAEQFLLDWDTAEGALRQAIRCPECGAFRVDYPQYARHSLLTNLAMGILAQLRLIERDYYCEDCHFTWPKEGFRARRARPHSAPFYFIEGVEQTGVSRLFASKGPGPAQAHEPEPHQEAA